MVLVLAIDPTNQSASLSGTFQLASLRFAPYTAQQDIETVVDIAVEGIQIVSSDATEFTPVGTGALVVVNSTNITITTPIELKSSSFLKAPINNVTVYVTGSAYKGIYPNM